MTILKFERLDAWGGQVAYTATWRVEVTRDDDHDGWVVHLFAAQSSDEPVFIGPFYEMALALRVAQAVFRVLDRHVADR